MRRLEGRGPGANPNLVMRGLDPRTHVFATGKKRITGSSPAMKYGEIESPQALCNASHCFYSDATNLHGSYGLFVSLGTLIWFGLLKAGHGQ